MGAGQLGVAIMTPASVERRSYERTRELFTHFSAGITGALAGLGITAEYRRKNDVEVGRKKIAGLRISFDPSGGLLFHSSLLVDLDISLMLSVLRTPFEKISDKEINSFGYQKRMRLIKPVLRVVRLRCSPVAVPSRSHQGSARLLEAFLVLLLTVLLNEVIPTRA